MSNRLQYDFLLSHPFNWCHKWQWNDLYGFAQTNNLIISYLVFPPWQRLSNGSIDPDDDVSRVIELSDTLEKQNKELGLTKDKMMQLNLRIAELEENLSMSQKEMIKAQESSGKFHRDLKEVGVWCGSL